LSDQTFSHWWSVQARGLDESSDFGICRQSLLITRTLSFLKACYNEQVTRCALGHLQTRHDR
jgi:hypothetical protein